jgi:hypothetical protein
LISAPQNPFRAPEKFNSMSFNGEEKADRKYLDQRRPQLQTDQLLLFGNIYCNIKTLY